MLNIPSKYFLCIYNAKYCTLLSLLVASALVCTSLVDDVLMQNTLCAIV